VAQFETEACNPVNSLSYNTETVTCEFISLDFVRTGLRRHRWNRPPANVVAGKIELQCLDCLFMPGMALLDAEDRHVAIDEGRHGSIPPIDTLAAHIFKGENRQIGREAACPCAKRFCLLGAGHGSRTGRTRSGCLAFQDAFNESIEGETKRLCSGDKSRLKARRDVEVYGHTLRRLYCK
jgi:hypothetical protein